MVVRISLLFLCAIIGLGWCLQLSSDISTSYAQEQQQQYSFLKKWGAKGISFGKFSQPLEIAIDLEGNVYVTDFTSVANKVQNLLVMVRLLHLGALLDLEMDAFLILLAST